MTTLSEKRYYTAKDIMGMLSVSKDKAYEILHSFAARGQLFRVGKTLRVRADYFEKYLNRMEKNSKDFVNFPTPFSYRR